MSLTLAAALTAAQVTAPFQIAQMKTSKPSAAEQQQVLDQEAEPAAAPIFSASSNLGVQYSTISGSGLCYRGWGADGLGFSVAGIPYQTTDGEKATGFINFGGQVMKAIYEGPMTRLYGLAGAGTGIFFDSGRRDQNLTLGIGADWAMSQKFLFTAAIGYSQSSQFRDAGKNTSTFEPGYTFGMFFAF